MLNKYDLTITNCAITIDNIYDWNTNEDTNSRDLKRRIIGALLGGTFNETTPLYKTAFLNPLHDLQKNRIIESGQELQLYSKQYLIDLGLFSDEELASVDNEPKNTNKNVLLNKYRRSYLLDDVIVQFEDDYEITIDNNERLYFKFLILMLCDYGVLFIEDILNHHVQKVTNRDKYITKLKKHLLIIPEILKDKDILNEIDTWIKQIQQTPIEKKKVNGLSNKELALIAFYNGNVLTRSNDGNALYGYYSKLIDKGNRLGADSKRMYKSKLTTFKNVIDNLQGNAKNKAKVELESFIEQHSIEYEK